MAVETIPFEKLDKQVSDLFEAVVVAAKRARQINQLRLLRSEIPRLIEERGEDSEEIRQLEEEQDFDAEKKIPTIALEELLEGKIKYEYVGEIEEEDIDFNVEI